MVEKKVNKNTISVLKVNKITFSVLKSKKNNFMSKRKIKIESDFLLQI